MPFICYEKMICKPAHCLHIIGLKFVLISSIMVSTSNIHQKFHVNYNIFKGKYVYYIWHPHISMYQRHQYVQTVLKLTTISSLIALSGKIKDTIVL